MTLLLKQGDLTAPIRDDALAARLGIRSGQRVPLARVRRAVLVFASIVLGGFFAPSYPGQRGWIHTTDDCPVWASARAEFLRKKERQ